MDSDHFGLGSFFMAQDCIIYQGHIDKDGYGRFGTKRVHRLVYEKVFGKIPEGLVIDHLCRTRACMNINHLEVVTIAENCRRGSKTKLNVQKIKEIRKLYKEKAMNQTEIAEIYKVGQDQISRIVNYWRWA